MPKYVSRVDINKIAEDAAKKAMASVRKQQPRLVRKSEQITIGDLNSAQKAVLAMSAQLQPIKPHRAPSAEEVRVAGGPGVARDHDSFLAVMKAQRELVKSKS